MVTTSTDLEAENLEVGNSPEKLDDTHVDDGSNIPVRNWWHMLLYAWDLVELDGLFNTNWESAPDLRELLTRILVDLTNRQIRRGLRGDYVDRSEPLKTVRGRIDFGRTLSGLLLYKGQLHSEYQEYSLNVPRNQIIVETLQRQFSENFAGATRERIDELKGGVGRLVRTLEEIDRIRLDRSLIANEMHKLGPNEREYKMMLRVCEMLYRPGMPRESSEESREWFRDWAHDRKNDIFEKFVANFYKLHLRGKGWDVSAQEWRYWVKKEERRNTGVRLPAMELDVVLRHRETDAMVVIDTKFYESVLSASRGSGRPTVNSDHVFQLYGYLQSLDGKDRRYPGSMGILLYARTVKDNVDFCTEVDGHPFRVYTLDLMQDWEDIERDLVKLVKDTVGS